MAGSEGEDIVWQGRPARGSVPLVAAGRLLLRSTGVTPAPHFTR